MRMRPTVGELVRVSGMLVLAAAFGAGCATPETSGESGTGGATGAGGSVVTGTGGAKTTGTGGTSPTGAGGSAPGTGDGGSGGTTGAGGATGTGGTTGAGATTGAGGSTATGTGGTGTGTGGQATGGATGQGGASGATGTAGVKGTGGATGTGGVKGTGGATGGTSGVTQSASCQIPTWPSATGSPVSISGTKSVSGVYDGKMALHNGTLNDCTTGDQSSTKAIIEIADGGTVKNVVFGAKIGDGIHCLGSCTIDNVWFQYVCDDAITMLGGAGKTATITNSGFQGARDKTIQHNGDGSTVVIDHVYVNIAGKLYRSCGQGCSSSAKRTAKISNVVALGASEIAGVSTNDHVTLSNICAYRTPSLCRTYQPGSETETTTGANGTNEGPDASCSYAGTDTHALLGDVTGSFSTDGLCPGSNSVKSGSTATACIGGFGSCLKGCAPGSYGFKEAVCGSAGTYTDSGACALPSDASIAAHFAGSNASSATSTVTNNATCTTEWAWATDGSGKYCMCVYKPGYYQQSSSSWTVWDCQSQWW